MREDPFRRDGMAANNVLRPRHPLFATPIDGFG